MKEDSKTAGLSAYFLFEKEFKEYRLQKIFLWANTMNFV
jgi:hypothetical protein